MRYYFGGILVLILGIFLCIASAYGITINLGEKTVDAKQEFRRL
jgi:hypothetical protein